MSNLQALLQALESPSPRIRNTAALDLMDMEDQRAVPALLRAITNPENVNYRGTLVYALSVFNCEEYLELMVDLALTGNFEVSIEACGIIRESAQSAASIERVRAHLNKFDPNQFLEEHHHVAWEELIELTTEP